MILGSNEKRKTFGKAKKKDNLPSKKPIIIP